MRVQEKGNGQALAIGSNVYSPKKNRFYALSSRGERESFPDVVTDMLQVFSINIYALLDLGDTISYVTPLVYSKFDILSNILNELFMVSTPVGESVVAKRVYRNCPILFPNRITYVELVELDMVDLDVIFGMDFLHACFPTIDCRQGW